MKIRQGFVSNSSSSSFICDVCNREEAGMDLSLSDIEMSECVNGHTFCDGEEVAINIEKKTPKEMREEMLKYYKTVEPSLYIVIQECKDDKELSDYWIDYLDEISGDERYEVSAEKCPICQFKNATIFDIANYYMRKAGTKKEDMAELLKKEFGNYDKLKEFLK